MFVWDEKETCTVDINEENPFDYRDIVITNNEFKVLLNPSFGTHTIIPCKH